MKRFRRVVIPVDFSDHSRRMVDECSSVFQDADGQEFHFVHVWYPPAFGYGLALAMDGGVAEVQGKLEEFVQAFAPGGEFQVKMALLKGHPATEVCRYAKEAECDLIALATHGFTGLKHLVIGSTAENVVRMASCHVMTLRAAG